MISFILISAIDVVSAHAVPTSYRAGRCDGVAVSPGDNIQALIDRHRARTTFCFARGVYRLSGSISTGTKHPILDLRSGATIDGQHGSFFGVFGEGAPNRRRGTSILGGVFQHFGNANAPLTATPILVNDNWLVKGSEFTNNFDSGLIIQGENARVLNVHTHHNGRYGLVVTQPCAGCSAPQGVVIANSEIAFNNTRKLPTNDNAGGTKFSAGTDGMIVRGNEVHDNYGAGLWWDSFHSNARVYNNVIYDNRNWGILWEASYGGVRIHHNVLKGNGNGGENPWLNNVQLLISCSDGTGGGIHIYRNTIDGAAYPLALINHDQHPTRTQQVYVHDNTLRLRSTSSRVGAVAFNGLTELFSATAGNRFEDNAYRVPDARAEYWGWNGEILSWSQWRALGHDDTGSVRARH
jgi:hypothetical protein